jgi:hypothetical protein
VILTATCLHFRGKPVFAKVSMTMGARAGRMPTTKRTTAKN